MNKILILNTGGTFNKIYNPNNGDLEVDVAAHALDEIAKKWLCDFEIVNIIGKDSLNMSDTDRKLLLDTIQQTSKKHIIVVHGTDTMDISASYLDEANIAKTVVLTGAMVPYHIDPVEATANLASAYGFLQNTIEYGIYVAMHSYVCSHDKIIKDRDKGKFISS